MFRFIFVLLAVSAFGGDEVQQTPAQAARSTYKAELIALRDADPVSVAQATCDDVRTRFGVAEDDSLRIEAELAATTSTPIGDVQALHRSRFMDLEKENKQTLATIRKQATDAGNQLEAARKALEAINTEIARIEAEEHYEQNAGKLVAKETPSFGSGLGGGGAAEGLGGLGTRGIGSGASGYGNGGLTVEFEIPVPKRTPDSLPSEFDLCFPDKKS